MWTYKHKHIFLMWHLKISESDLVYACFRRTPVNHIALCVYVCYLGEDEAIIVGVPGILWSVLHGMKEQHRHDLCCAATWWGMTATKMKTKEELNTQYSKGKLGVPPESSVQIYVQSILSTRRCRREKKGRGKVAINHWSLTLCQLEWSALIHARAVVVRELLCKTDSTLVRLTLSGSDSQ